MTEFDSLYPYMKNQPLMFKVRLLRDIESLYSKFPKGSVQTAVNLGGSVMINGYQNAKLSDKDWELYWDQDALDKMIGETHGN